jgi:hypothetical protein
VVENRATVAGEGRRPEAKCDALSSVAAEGPRASMVNGFVLAIVGAESERGGCVVRVSRREVVRGTTSAWERKPVYWPRIR